MKFVFRIVTLAALPFAGVFAESQLKIAGEDPIPVRREIFGVNQLAYGDGYGLVEPGTHTVVPELIQLLRESGLRAQRYPGGCGGTHNFNWKVAAGLEGKKPALGLLEFLNLCEETGMTPILGLSAFRGSPQEAAELVEFLNAPDDGKSSWAKRRAGLGHPAPYHVTLFEYGNESYHGNHYLKPEPTVTPEKYAQDYLAFRRAMRSVDPRIRLGVVMHGPSELGESSWNNPVMAVLGKEFDFLVPHVYVRVYGYDRRNFQRSLFEQEQKFRRMLESCRNHAAKAGSTDLQLAVTEFNTDLKSHATLAGALMNSEWLRLFCYAPEVFTAHYWQYVNEAWGMVRNRKAPYLKRPNYLMIQLFSRYLLDELLTPEITGSVAGRDFAEAKKLSAAELERNLLPEQPWIFLAGKSFRLRELPDGVLEVEFPDDTAMNFFHASKKLPADSRYGYRLTGEIRVEGMKGSSGAALELGDSRGWEATRSAVNTKSTFSPEWTRVSVDYIPLEDISGLTVKARRHQGGGAGKMFFRNLKVTRFVPESELRKVVSATVSRSADGKRFAVIAVNSSLEPETLTIGIPGTVPVSGEVLTGPSLQSDNETVPDTVKVIPLEVKEVADGARVTLPPHSLAGILLKTK